jgi:2-oxoglutarate dehydrogenase E2 component (dihydrolipoamide succinyltransferase)
MIPIKVPPLGESIVEATVSRWLKREGDTVAAGETLVELETDKVTVEVPATTAGVLVRRLQQEGDVVGLGAVLAELDETAAASAPAAAVPAAASVAAASPAVPGAEPARPAPPADVRPSPAARRAAADLDVDLAQVHGTGRGGVVSKPDVIQHAAAEPARTPLPARPASAVEPAPAVVAPPSRTDVVPSSAPVASMANRTRETREKMSTRRKRIAEHLLESAHATAHLTTFNEIDMSAVESLRGRVKERIEKEHGVKLSFMPFFVRAACLALKQFPTVNARVDGDHIVYHHYVNMGIAVASDAGLVVPTIKDADGKGLIQIARDIVAIARKARDGKLVMDDLTGGTFTITNGGVFGSLLSTPIINFPQAGILGLHKVQDRPVAVDGRVEVRPMMYVALSYDHRLIDGQQAVLFLVRVRELMEDPALMAID